MCSGAMGLPVSGFPNMTAYAKEDPTGNPWLSTLDFFKVCARTQISLFFASAMHLADIVSMPGHNLLSIQCPPL